MEDFVSVVEQYRETTEFIIETRAALEEEKTKLDALRIEYAELITENSVSNDVTSSAALEEAKEEYEAFIEDSSQTVKEHEEIMNELIKEQRTSLDKIIEIIVYMNEKFPREIHIKQFCNAVIASTKNVDVKYD